MPSHPWRQVSFFAAVFVGIWFSPPRVLAQERGPAVSIANFPIRFEPNVGQVDPPALFVARDTDMELRLRARGFDLSSGAAGKHTSASFAFLDALPEASISGDGLESSRTNYLIGSDPLRWLTDVPNYAQVKYASLYPHIDLVFHGNGEHLEHDFVVSPGGHVDAIRMRLVSPGQLVRNPDGSIKISTPSGTLLLSNPSVYQIGESGRQSREGRFVLKARNEIGFAVKSYDRTRPLIIDPVLVFSTFLAPDEIQTQGVATDALGNTYVAGLTFSSTSPAATAGAFQPTCQSCPQYPDAFVMKLNASGSAVIYSTFLGGSNYDQPNAIAVDANGDAIVAGSTQSTDFPVKNPITFQPGGFGSTFGFVASLSPDGSSLNYSSLLGNTVQQTQFSGTSVISLVLDASGNAYVTGGTNAPTFPVTTGAFHNFVPAYPYNVVFVSKFLTNGSLGYSALLGDVSPQGPALGPNVTRIALDSSDNAYLLGIGDAFFPITTGAYQPTIPAPSTSAPFVAKLSADGSQLIYSTFVGPYSTPTGLAIDAAGDAFLTGRVNTSFPLTPNAYQKTFPGTCCASYLGELNPSGSQLLYGTYFSGSGQVAAFPPGETLSNTLRLDSNENIWLAGITTDAGFPLVQPVQSTLSTSAFTGFLAQFDPTGTNLLFSTYFGSFSQGSQSVDLAIDPNGKGHIAGLTGPDLYITPGAFLNSVTPPAPNTMLIYGFAAVIDPTGSSPAVCLGANTAGLPFGPVMVGTFRTETVTVANCGTATASLTISSIVTSSSAYTVPASGNNCLSPVAPNTTCTFDVVFAPTAAGSFFANLKITANTPIPQTIVGLFGDGTVPIIQLNTTMITFDPLFVGQTGSTRAVLVFNAGTAPLVIDPVQTTVTPTPTFTWQNGCTQPIDPRQSCVLPLVFTAPNSAGTTTGTFSIASNDPANPVVTVSLSGTAVDSYPVPAITRLDHPSITKGSGQISLGVIGQNFFPTSTVFVNGVKQSTTYNSASFLSALLSSSLFSAMGELTVRVSNPSPGGGVSNALLLTVYQSVAITPAGLIYDPLTQLLYASVPASAPANPNTIIPIDPNTGKTGTPIPVGHDPKQLALSQDGTYLYVAVNGDHAIQRINMSTPAVEKTFALPNLFGTPLIVSDLKVVPGTSQSVVVSLEIQGGSPGEAGLALFNGDGLVNSLPGFPTNAVDSFAFAGNPPLVYSLPLVNDPYPSGTFFGTFTIDSSGIHPAVVPPVSSADQNPGSLVASDGTLLFTNSGQVWNPTAQKLLGTYSPALFFAASVVPDDPQGRTFFLDPFAQYDQQGATAVEAYDQTSFALISSVPFFSASVPGTNAIGLSRWGADGFAFAVGNFTPAIGSGQLIIFRSGIAGSAVSTSTSLSLSATNSVFGQPLSLTASVTANSNAVTSGAVIFFDNGVQIGTGSLDSSGQATFETTSLAVGQHALSTGFAGSKGFEISISAKVTATIVGLPATSLNPTSLSFDDQTGGTTSAPQTITLTNSGSATLLISSIAVTGADNGDFAITVTTCPLSGGTLATGSSCTIQVTFTPVAPGPRNASVLFTDNADGSPQSVSLTGTTADVTLSAASGGSTSATVTAGQTATFSLEISPLNGFSGAVTLNCTGAPTNATCSANPSTLTLTNSAVPFSVSVATTSRSVAGPFASRRLRVPSMVARMPTLLGALAVSSLMIIFLFVSFSRDTKWRNAMIFSSTILLCALLVSCAGGGSSGQVSSTSASTQSGTPAGNYNLSVNAVSGGTTRSISLTLNVQ